MNLFLCYNTNKSQRRFPLTFLSISSTVVNWKWCCINEFIRDDLVSCVKLCVSTFQE